MGRPPVLLVVGLAAVLSGRATGGDFLAYWPFEEGTGVSTADVTGNGNDASFSGSVGWSTDTNIAHSTRSLEFTGGYLSAGTLPNVDAHTSTGGDWAVSLWIKPDDTSGDRGLLGKRSPYHAWPSNWQIIRYGTGISLWSPSASWIGNFAIADTAWHHLVFSVGGGTVTFYLDGTLKGTAQWGTPGSGMNFYIGWNNDYAPWLGHIDDVVIWGRALSETEIQDLADGKPPMLLRPRDNGAALIVR